MSGLPRLIAVEGPIGVGKTTLARRLAAQLGARTLLERAEENPFLPGFYQSPERFALATQLHFLVQRARQMTDLKRAGAGDGTFVSDFMMEKDRLFARLNLDDDEYELYERLHARLGIEAPTPGLVIYLRAPVGVLLERVRCRAIGFERAITEEYLSRVSDAYAEYFECRTAVPQLVVDTGSVNYADDAVSLEPLLELVTAVRRGRQYFDPAVASGPE